MGESRNREARLRKLPGVSRPKRPGPGVAAVPSGLDCRPPLQLPPGVRRWAAREVTGGGEIPGAGRREGIWRKSSAASFPKPLIPPPPIPLGLKLGSAQADAHRFPHGVVL